MPVNFKYAMVEINGKPVLVDQKTFDVASKALKDGLARVTELTKELRAKGFALETPEGMSPVTLGSANDFANWVSANLDGGKFNLSDSIGALPEPFKSGLSALTNTKLVIYSAALFYYTVETKDKTDETKKTTTTKM